MAQAEDEGKNEAVGVCDEDLQYLETKPAISECYFSNVRREEKLSKSELQLLDTTAWLEDTHINAASTLLRKQFPGIGALYNTELGSVLKFPPARDTNGEKWLQIIHDRANHWVLAAYGFNENNFVSVYDSQRSLKVDPKSATDLVKPHIIKCIAKLLNTDQESFSIARMSNQFQQDSHNCGPFTIAFATSLAFGKNPSYVTYDTSQLRSHLKTCLEKGVISEFPEAKSARKRATPQTFNTACRIPVFCVCRMPFFEHDTSDTTTLVRCHSCTGWYHHECCAIPRKVIENEEVPWSCLACQRR